MGEFLQNFISGFVDKSFFMNGRVLLCLFLLVLFIQFILLYILYQSNKQSYTKIVDLESLLGVTADRVLSIQEKTDSVTYQDVVDRLRSGQTPVEVAKSVKVNLEELEALERILNSIK